MGCGWKNIVVGMENEVRGLCGGFCWVGSGERDFMLC